MSLALVNSCSLVISLLITILNSSILETFITCVPKSYDLCA